MYYIVYFFFSCCKSSLLVLHVVKVSFPNLCSFPFHSRFAILPLISLYHTVFLGPFKISFENQQFSFSLQKIVNVAVKNSDLWRKNSYIKKCKMRHFGWFFKHCKLCLFPQFGVIFRTESTLYHDIPSLEVVESTSALSKVDKAGWSREAWRWRRYFLLYLFCNLPLNVF